MIFARIGHGPCYYHWNEIFAGVQIVFKPDLGPPNPCKLMYFDRNNNGNRGGKILSNDY